MSDLTPRGPSEIVLYQTEDGSSRIEVRLAEGTVWLSQAPMAELYQTTKQNISLHIRNVLSEGELEEESVVKDSLTTAADGKRYRTLSYSLPMIIAVGTVLLNSVDPIGRYLSCPGKTVFQLIRTFVTEKCASRVRGSW